MKRSAFFPISNPCCIKKYKPSFTTPKSAIKTLSSLAGLTYNIMSYVATKADNIFHICERQFQCKQSQFLGFTFLKGCDLGTVCLFAFGLPTYVPLIDRNIG